MLDLPKLATIASGMYTSRQGKSTVVASQTDYAGGDGVAELVAAIPELIELAGIADGVTAPSPDDPEAPASGEE